MTTTTLDSIIRSVLLRRGYTLHWYIDALLAARDCLRELNFDTLGIINTKPLVLNDAMEAELPDDYCDYVGAFAKVGQSLIPLVPTSKLNPLIAYAEGSGQQIPYSEQTTSDDGATVFPSVVSGAFGNTVTWNQYGENVGRLFGYNSGYTDTFQVFANRNVIKVNEESGITDIVFQYISDGMNVDAATHIEAYAIKTIEAYVMWQFKEMNRSYSESEKERARQLFDKEHLKLRARKADWSIEKIKRIAQQANYGSPK